MAFKLPGIDFKANINATDIKVDFGAKNIANTPAHAFETKLTSINKALDPSALSQRGIQNLSHQLWNTTPNTLSGGINPDTNRGLSARLTNIKNTLADGLGLAFGRVKNAVSPTNTPTNTTGMRGLVNQFFEAPIDTIGLGFTQGFKALNIGKESLLASGQQAITHTKTAAMGLGSQLWAPFNGIGSAAANQATELSQSISNKADA
ncbi:MAG TPA: hypothetical protein PLQ67_04560, partial [Burkholderiaceae bacterium]|nr:hypothetical protein [Burkholderiaceae bacterium]